MSNLLTLGCSYAVGHEVEPRVNRFSNLVAKENGMLDWNEAKVGGSNQGIQRMCMNALLGKQLYTQRLKDWEAKEYKSKNTNFILTKQWTRLSTGTGMPQMVVIMWTSPTRIEHLSCGAKSDRLSDIDIPYTWRGGNWKSFDFDNDLYPTKDSEPMWSPVEPPEVRAAGMNFLNIRNLYWCLRETINCMLATKYFLQANNVPSLHYLMSSGNIQPLLYLLDEPTWEGTNVLWESLDLNRKQIIEELPFLESDGFYEIAKKNNCQFGPKGHPLKDGHRLMADIINRDIKNGKFLTKNNQED